MKNMLVVTGCGWITWATTKNWKIVNFILENKIIKVCFWILGIYNIFLAFFGKGPKGQVLLIIDFALAFILDIFLFIDRLKKGKKGIMKIYQLGLGFIFIIVALWMFYIDLNKIYVGITTLTGAMMMITVPFQEAIEIVGKEKNNN